MKKSLPLLFLLASVGAQAQNFDDNKVNFGYIQLPTHPIDEKYSTYDVLVNKQFDQANTDSLNMYQFRLDTKMAAYDAAMIAWKDQKKVIDRNHLTQLAAWEKSTNSGTITPKPVKPPYPAQPETPEEEMPYTHDDFSNDIVTNQVILQGYSKGPSGALITLDVNPIKNFKVVMSTKGEAAATKYVYTCQYQMPVGLKVETPAQGVILQTILSTGNQTYSIGEYASRYEFDLWILDNRDKLWNDVQRSAQQKIAGAVNAEINAKCGFPVKNRATEVYTVKRFKDHAYTDLYSAYQAAQQGYLKVGADRDGSPANEKLNEAIAIWLKALEESNVGDKNARINHKVTAMLYANLAEAYLWTADFDKADYYVNLGINSGVMKFKNHCKNMQSILSNRRMRYNTNF